MQYQMVAARNALRNGDAQQMADEIGKYIEEYRSSNGVIESCRCIRNILDVFYKNSKNEMLMTKVTSMTGMDEILHALFAMPREKGGSGESVSFRYHLF